MEATPKKGKVEIGEEETREENNNSLSLDTIIRCYLAVMGLENFILNSGTVHTHWHLVMGLLFSLYSSLNGGGLV